MPRGSCRFRAAQHLALALLIAGPPQARAGGNTLLGLLFNCVGNAACWVSKDLPGLCQNCHTPFDPPGEELSLLCFCAAGLLGDCIGDTDPGFSAVVARG